MPWFYRTIAPGLLTFLIRRCLINPAQSRDLRLGRSTPPFSHPFGMSRFFLGAGLIVREFRSVGRLVLARLR